jgi:hypothetical protein
MGLRPTFLPPLPLASIGSCSQKFFNPLLRVSGRRWEAIPLVEIPAHSVYLKNPLLPFYSLMSCTATAGGGIRRGEGEAGRERPIGATAAAFCRSQGGSWGVERAAGHAATWNIQWEGTRNPKREHRLPLSPPSGQCSSSRINQQPPKLSGLLVIRQFLL